MSIALPTRVRRIVYIVAGILSLAFGATAAAYSAIGHPTPTWYVAAAGAWSFVTAAPIFLALVNVNPEPAQPLEQTPEPDAELAEAAE